MVALLDRSVPRVVRQVNARPNRPARPDNVAGRRLDHSIDARRQPRLSLRLQQVSEQGLSLVSDTPLQCGERLTMTFEPHRPARGWDAYARVVRCEPAGQGYRVAVAFDPLPAA